MVQVDSMTGFGRIARFARRHRVAVFVVVLMLTVLCFQVVPGGTLGGMLVQAAVLSVVALGGIALVDRRTLKGELASASERLLWAEAARWTAYVLIVGLIFGAAAWWGAVSSGELSEVSRSDSLTALLVRFAATVALCLLTGVFEEGVFRVLALDAFVSTFGSGRRGVLYAAIAASVLFGMLHVSFGEASALGGVIAWVQSIIKPVQAGLFGFFMAAVFVRTRNLWIIVGIHALFDMLYAGPLMVAGKLQLTYVTGSDYDLALLALSTLLLVPAVVASAKFFLSRDADGTSHSMSENR